MKRSPLKRKKPLGCTRMGRGRSKRSAKSKGHLFPKGVDEAYRTWIRAQPCHVLRQSSGEWYLGFWLQGAPIPAAPRFIRVVCAHVKSRGSGAPDRANIIPLDAALHDEQGRTGWKAFAAKYNLGDPKKIAEQVWARYVAEVGAQE